MEIGLWGSVGGRVKAYQEKIAKRTENNLSLKLHAQMITAKYIFQTVGIVIPCESLLLVLLLLLLLLLIIA